MCDNAMRQQRTIRDWRCFHLRRPNDHGAPIVMALDLHDVSPQRISGGDGPSSTSSTYILGILKRKPMV